MLVVYLTLIIAVVVIYFSCELFVNAIEWVGRKFNVSQCAVGTILAAFGTALPESAITLMAVAFNASVEQKDIGVGSALGGPLVLGTLSYAVVGLCIIFFRKKRKLGLEIDIDSAKLGRDQLWFISIFIFKVLLGLVVFSFKPLLGFLFLAAYGLYFYKEMRGECTLSPETLNPLIFQSHHVEPKTRWVLLQTAVALTLIFAGSQLFVKNLEALSVFWNLPPHIVALLLSPIATELPEILNAVIWVRQGKEMLALGNISGSMMIQATIPSAFGIIFTPWLFDKYLLGAAIVTLLSVIYLWSALRRDKFSPTMLIYSSFFYFVFASLFLIF